MKKLMNKRGMTMAEMLLVVAIVAILSGVAFVSVNKYQRSLGQVERDGIAKEIFVAAQNHLTMAYGEGYLGIVDFGVLGKGSGDSNNQVYYVIVDGTNSFAENTILGRMLPFGSIDETVRKGGNYIIRYQKDTGLVLDVFYCSKGSSTFDYEFVDFTDSDDYSTFFGLRGEGSTDKSNRQNWNEHILGWYGAEVAVTLPTLILDAPSIVVRNEEKLYVEVYDPNYLSGKSYEIRLIVTGLESKAQIAYELVTVSDHLRTSTLTTGGNRIYVVVLDDVTRSGLHFGNITADTAPTQKFIPGEDITVQAVAYNNSVLANIAYSSKDTVNSLFAGVTTSGVIKTAEIVNFRHLENLSQSLSRLGANSSQTTYIAKAEQTSDMSWPEFRKAIRKIESDKQGESTASEDTVVIYNTFTDHTANGCYWPIEPNYGLTYDGTNHYIYEVTVQNVDNAGLFGAPADVDAISNLALVDFNISGTGSAGALAGTLDGTAVTNVIAINTDSTAEAANVVTASADSGKAGGLVGIMSGELHYCGSSMKVNGKGAAGGLVGSFSGSLEGCYAGGLVEDAIDTLTSKLVGTKYSNTDYNVTSSAGPAGGLIGSMSGASTSVNYSYSTCSASGTSSGGFIGTASGGSIKNSYSTGLVNKSSTNKHAFIGSGSSSLENCYYYSIINKESLTDADGDAIPGTMSAEGIIDSGIKALDLDAKIYNSFISGAYNAKPYNASLVKFYKGKYFLKSVKDLDSALPSDYFVNVHYGDWPAPELFTINE